MKPADFTRLQSLRLDTDLAGLEMADEGRRFDALRIRHEAGTAPRAVSSFNLYQTPRSIAAEMASRALERFRPGWRILEPSAGLGRLLWPILAITGEAGEIVAVEEAGACYQELKGATDGAPGLRLVQADFLTLSAADLGGSFDAVVMNPPFERGRDVKHITHAAGMLKAGGILVGLCYDGETQRKHLRPIVDDWRPLPEGSFASEGTRAGVVMVTIRKDW